MLRVANRIGIAESDDPVVVEQQLCAALPQERWTRTSDTLILHGRRICRPKPLCDAVRGARRRATTSALVIAPVARPAEARALGRQAQPQAAANAEATDQWTAQRSSSSSLSARARFPRRFRDAMQNIAIVVEDEPSRELLDEMEIEPPDTLLGLYQGTPLTERPWGYGNTLPDRILIFQGPHERDSDDEDDLVVAIARNADPRDRPLLRPERGGDRGDRGAILAGQRRTDE